MKGKQKQHKVIHHAHRYEQFDEAFLRYLARHRSEEHTSELQSPIVTS